MSLSAFPECSCLTLPCEAAEGSSSRRVHQPTGPPAEGSICPQCLRRRRSPQAAPPQRQSLSAWSPPSPAHSPCPGEGGRRCPGLQQTELKAVLRQFLNPFSRMRCILQGVKPWVPAGLSRAACMQGLCLWTPHRA